MSSKKDFENTFPSSKQIGGSHYKNFSIQPYTFITSNDLSFFQGNVIKYVCRYKNKNGIEDLKKIIHYCELEIQELSKIKERIENVTNKIKAYEQKVWGEDKD